MQHCNLAERLAAVVELGSSRFLLLALLSSLTGDRAEMRLQRPALERGRARFA